jgi:sucrose-phosphate synthase
MHLALGGCLGRPPVRFGLTSDTGGHIGYVLGAATAQALLPRIDKVCIVTRLFEDHRLGPEYARPADRIGLNIEIIRIATDNRAYLEKEELGNDLPAFKDAFCEYLSRSASLPDVIHAHFSDAASVAEVARARFGIPFVYTPHALGRDKRDRIPGNPSLDARIVAEHTAIVQADAIIVSTRNEAQHQVAAYGVPASTVRTRCIPPGVPSKSLEKMQAMQGVPFTTGLDDPSKPIVLAIARPVRKKNLAAVVRAFLCTPELIARANLVILAGQHGLGSSSDEERQVVSELKMLCGDPALRGRVALPPEHSGADVARLYSKAAAGGVFVNPALHEPFGLTLIEAAEAGVPVVATRDGGPADIIASIGHGRLVDPLDDIEIGANCLRIILDRRLHEQYSQAGRANIHKFSWARYADASVSLYASLHFKPQLLASDIDNTLTGCCVGAHRFRRWHARMKMPFVVATGRSLNAARAVLVAWDLPEPDAYIVDVGTRIVTRRDDRWLACDDYAANLDEGWHRAEVAGLLANLGAEPQAPETSGPHKLSFFGTAEAAHTIRVALAEAGLTARVVHSHGHLIDLLAPGAGKAAALAWYAATLGLTLGDCISAGDSGNDLDMLEASGCAIAVTNGGSELDGLPPRRGLVRVAGRNANGIMEGLATFGLVVPLLETEAA